MAAVRAIAALAREEPSDIAARAYSGETPIFGPDFLIPSPFDPRLILRIAPAVARAACETGVAARPIEDWPAYVDRLTRFVFRSGLVMKPIFSTRQDGERQARHLCRRRGRARAARRAGGAGGRPRPSDPDRPPARHRRQAEALWPAGSEPGTDFTLINPEDDPRYRDYVDLLIELAGRRGVTPGGRAHDGAHRHHGDRRAGAEARRCRRHDLRPRRPLRTASAQRQPDHRRRAPASGTATCRRCPC